MINLRKYIKAITFFFFISVLILFSSFFKLYAGEINWLEVANTNNKIQFIDSQSIKYNSKGYLSVITKLTERNPANQQILYTDTFLMAVDCENRLFSKLPINSELKQVKDWEIPINDILTKKTIINACSY